jgi:hypothetical protein
MDNNSTSVMFQVLQHALQQIADLALPVLDAQFLDMAQQWVHTL